MWGMQVVEVTIEQDLGTDAIVVFNRKRYKLAWFLISFNDERTKFEVRRGLLNPQTEVKKGKPDGR